MTYQDEDLLISRPPLSQQRRSPDRHRFPSRATSSTPYLRIECQAEERHFIDSSPFRMTSSSKAARFTTDHQIRPGRFRSEIVVHNDPNVDLHIKRLRVAFHDQAEPSATIQAKASRSHSVNNSGSRQTTSERSDQRKFRSTSLPRHNSQAVLHQWIDDICSNEKLMVNDDIVFFLKNGEFLARI